jgi:diguanylate cyclase (GGDEF)-like protein
MLTRLSWRSAKTFPKAGRNGSHLASARAGWLRDGVHWTILNAVLLIAAVAIGTTLLTDNVGGALTDGHMARARFWACAAGLTALFLALVPFARVRQLAHLHHSATSQLDTAMNNITQGLMLYDASSRIILFNRRYIDMYGLSADVIQPGRLFRDVMKHRKATGSFKGDPDAFCDEVLKNVSEMRLTHRVLTTSDGRTIRMVNQPLPTGGWVTTHEDITDLKRFEQRIEHLAHYDPLTGLPNRTLFRERLEQEFKPGLQPFALLYIDLDQFKEINDSLGHSIGDDFLRTLAKRFAACVGESDCIARLGGDEFGIIQTGIAGAADVTVLIDRIYRALADPIVCDGHTLSANASIGIAMAVDAGADIDELIRMADLAMYGAKSSGRRTYRFFDPQMDAQVKARRQLEIDLREAIETDGFELFYQPVVDIGSGEIAGCEALLRWTHPVRGPISPVDFIPVAEDTGLINELGEWVLQRACREAMSWPSHIKLAVNVSPVQFKSDSLGLRIIKVLAASGLAADRLELEITEAVLMRDDEAALATLHQLRAIGVRIALDDFGIGYSSLSYLQRFPFDKIKIDRSFVGSLRDSGDASIVQAVVTIADARDMVTTAEGVETPQQLEQLRQLGCTQMQGWLFSKAKSASDIRAMLGVPRGGTAQAAAG